MGCGASVDSGEESSYSRGHKSQKALQAAILIQNWFRRNRARLEARRRCTWRIFQNIEYAGEQDQLKLFNFFNDVLAHVDENGEKNGQLFTETPSSEIDISQGPTNEPLLQLTDPAQVEVRLSYDGPHVELPLTLATVRKIIEHIECKRTLHVKYVLLILREARERLMALPNVLRASSVITKQITICGDLHGKLDDLFMIFHKNGLPSAENPYIFNGDMVDRGPGSVEITIILFAFFLLYPNGVFLNRGNHEDHIMNLRYGFVKEVISKYKEHSARVLKLYEDVFGWLPLATVVNSKILVTHGGISSITDLETIGRINRHKYISVLKPPIDKTNPSKALLMEWRQVLDLLWSDPKSTRGCKPNTFRGGGCYFGPDVTEHVLRKNNLELLVRSHECKFEGYEYTHNGKVVTIFSASNYYEQGSNRGAYMKIVTDMEPYFVQYQVSKTKTHLSLKQRVGIVENSAIRELKEQLYANESTLLAAFKEKDPSGSGYLSSSQWADAIESVLKLDLPWHMIKHQIADVLPDGRVDYMSCLNEYTIKGVQKKGNGPSITETLYRNKSNLETIFRMMDKDNSGAVSMEEFEECCQMLNQHMSLRIPTDSIKDLAKSIDMDKNGYIDFNEFLEAFRLVNKVKLDSKPNLQPSRENSPVNSIHIIT